MAANVPITEIMKNISVEEIEKSYTAGELTYQERGKLLRDKAMAVNMEALGDNGYLHAIYRKTLEEANKGWENLKEAATHEQGDGGSIPINIRNEAYYAGLAIWGQIQILNSIPSAVGEVAGLAAERLALQNGASAGLAKFIGITADFGSNFIPAAGLAKASVAGVKGLQAVAGAAAKKAAPKLEEGIMRKVVEHAIDTSVKKDGIEKTIFSKAELATEGGAKKAEAALPKPEYIVTETGSVIDKTTGEVIPKYLQKGKEFEAAKVIKAVKSPMAEASEVAATKLDIPQSQMGDVLTGWAPDLVAKGDMEGAAAQFVKETKDMSAKQSEWMKEFIKSMKDDRGSVSIPSWAQVTEVYRNMLLANPAGRIRDMISNIGSGFMYGAQRTIGAITNIPVPLTGGERATTLTGTAYYAKGMALAAHEAFGSFASAFTKAGLEAEGVAKSVTRFDKPLETVLPMWMNAPTSVTVGIDRGFKTLHRRGALYAHELELAQKEGRAFDIQNVNLPTKEAWEKAVQISEYLTFQNELGHIGKNLASGFQTGVLELYFPFLKTPVNLMKYAWNNTPGLQLASGRLWNELKAGGEAADLAMGRLTLSNMFGFYVTELVKSEMITGQGPMEPAVRAAWLKTHQPYSVRVGDRWIPLDPISPIAETVRMIADYTSIMADLPDANKEQIGQAILVSIHENIGKNTWWSGAEDLVKAVSNAGKSDAAYAALEKFVTNPITTIGSGGSLGGAIRQAIDPTVKETRGMVEQWYAKLPIWGKDVPLKYDSWGDPIIPPQAIGSRWAPGVNIVNPVKEITKSHERMHMEGDRLKVKMPFFADSIGGSPHEVDLIAPRPGDKIPIGLSAQQDSERMKFYGNLLDHPELGMNALMDMPEYKDAPDALKRQMFQGRLLESKKTADEAIKIKYPELSIKALQNDARQYLPQIKEPADQYAAQWQYKEAIDFWEKITPDEINNILRFSVED